MDSNNENEPMNPTLNKGDVMRSFTLDDMEKAFEAGFNRGAEVHGSTAGWLGCELESLEWSDWIKNYA